jgi:hypothetical protein
MKVHHLTALVVAALLAPAPAFAFGTIEGFYGIVRPPNPSFRAAASGAKNDTRLFKDSLQNAGGDVLLNLGTFEFGAIADVTFAQHSANQSAIGALAGMKLPLGPVRLDLLGEAGGHRYGNIGSNPSIVKSGSDQWFAYLGLRPGVAFKFGAPDAPGFLLGLWGFARWDLTTKNAAVTVSGATDQPGKVKLGGVSIGATVRAGFDF